MAEDTIHFPFTTEKTQPETKQDSQLANFQCQKGLCRLLGNRRHLGLLSAGLSHAAAQSFRQDTPKAQQTKDYLGGTT